MGMVMGMACRSPLRPLGTPAYGLLETNDFPDQTYRKASCLQAALRRVPRRGMRSCVRSVVGRLRFILESIRPEIRRYIVESGHDAVPFDRRDRGLVYRAPRVWTTGGPSAPSRRPRVLAIRCSPTVEEFGPARNETPATSSPACAVHGLPHLERRSD